MGVRTLRPLLQAFLAISSLICFLLISSSLNAQVNLRCQMYYDVEEGWSQVAKVRVLQDNQEYETMETSKKGKFKLFLPLGHDYLVEISKEFHFTTRFAISTKMPQEKLDQRPFVSYDLQGDLIRNFEGLDGSIMDKPILIYRYIPEKDGFEIDDDHLKAIRDRVERLMAESDKLKKKGADPIAKPIPKQAKKVEQKEPEIKEAPVIEEEQMISSTTHDEDDVVEVAPAKVPEKKEEPKVEEPIVEEKAEEKENVNETYEMQLRRQRLEREKKRKENLALKRGYESSLIRQVAEESKKMSQAELQKKTKEKEDSSLIEKARKEAEMKKARNELREQQQQKASQATNNKQMKSQRESGMIRDVAASTRVIQAKAIQKTPPSGVETAEGKKFVLEPKVRENKMEDEFKLVENLYFDYPSYSVSYSKETYNFGMINYYIDNQAVEKAEFCKRLDDLKSYKFELKCN